MKLLQHIIIGCLIGLSVSYTITTIRALVMENHVFKGEDLLKELLIALALGAIIGAITLILESDRFSFPILVAIHFCIVQITVFIVGALANWYEFNVTSILIMFCIIVTVYIFSWGIALILEKREIDHLNQQIRKR